MPLNWSWSSKKIVFFSVNKDDCSVTSVKRFLPFRILASDNQIKYRWNPAYEGRDAMSKESDPQKTEWNHCSSSDLNMFWSHSADAQIDPSKKCGWRTAFISRCCCVNSFKVNSFSFLNGDFFRTLQTMGFYQFLSLMFLRIVIATFRLVPRKVKNFLNIKVWPSW